MRRSLPRYASFFAATLSLLAPRPRPRQTSPPRANHLAAFHPAIARGWLTAASGKLLQPQHVLPSSRKLVWWRCPHCAHEFHKRIDLHVAAGGMCPKCEEMPPTSSTCVVVRAGRTGRALSEERDLDTTPMVRHRCRPSSALATLAAPNANRVKSSIADDGYLREVEQRNLLPMLARNFEKESDRIPEDEMLFVSPKLDGVRCVVAWNARDRKLSFFSRSGTLFECCDARIEPALRPLFERDPALVLDGELYNHNVEDFEQLISAIRTTRERRTKEVIQLQATLQYHVFDIMYAKQMPEMSIVPFSERYAYLVDCIASLHTRGKCKKDDPVQMVPVVSVTKASVPSALRDALADGYEGVMIRRDNTQSGRKGPNPTPAPTNRNAIAGYAYGARSPCLLKHKVMHDDEYVIVSGVEGKGKWKGCLGAFVCRTKKGHCFTVSPATTEQNKRSMWCRMKDYKGKVLTVQFQELSANGVPRFPVGKCIRGAKNGKDWI